ncbi:pyridoxal phosphate-dependent aminotransferase [Aerococcus sanguinicola]|uniref:pyridoxal phosphate-dependent aminotransferase n=2 Tax=Aerococcus TaxID=1375 RepID=UPI0008A60415|nr:MULTISPECIES: pyridoxal phosphate-dependent aminotransferase [unclassified Aerococcus]KAB0647812.1 pyridoxal phosphate-dependent aminotransferase [Aerococcus sanguinicola]MDK6232941.1 pyridoxal phosphate-dependent aminotransferase [Aerococcus sp. UMB10185]MDK6855235.1 pyridoxal phosphate-dependent aminotransferase [Aerococcus sp. UMB7533]MDK8502066.1 pyridoxal phosphate-dependent aminotransferase [Aerococcus sp. UMB1112A]OFN05276.1 aspartate aminotransferase [Aerococcus sp. HMSC062A02]
MISERIMNLQESKTLAANDKARELKAQGRDIISLTVGEPDFDTPQYILDYAKEAMYAGKGHHYTPASGALELREAIAHYHEKHDGVVYEPSEIFAGNGGKLVLYYLFQVLVNPGDEVLIPQPYWVSYYEQIRLAGGKPVIVETKESNNFILTVEELDAVCTDKTKLLVLNTPSNPSGAVLSPEEMRAIGDYCVDKGILIISDEMYYQLVYNGTQAISMASISPSIRKQTIVVNGASKAYAMTGWRLGYCMGDEDIIRAMNKLASQVSGNPSGIAQYATIGALTGPQDDLEEMRQTFEKRLNAAYDRMKAIPGFNLAAKPRGAFYLFPNCSEAAALTGYATVDDFAMALLEEAGVASVVGSAFGMPDFLRFSYAADQDKFLEAMDRIDNFMTDHQVQA